MLDKTLMLDLLQMKLETRLDIGFLIDYKLQVCNNNLNIEICRFKSSILCYII